MDAHCTNYTRTGCAKTCYNNAPIPPGSFSPNLPQNVQQCLIGDFLSTRLYGGNNAGSSLHAVFLKNGKKYFSRAANNARAGSPVPCRSCCESDSEGLLFFKNLNPGKLVEFAHTMLDCVQIVTLINYFYVFYICKSLHFVPALFDPCS